MEGLLDLRRYFGCAQLLLRAEFIMIVFESSAIIGRDVIALKHILSELTRFFELIQIPPDTERPLQSTTFRRAYFRYAYFRYAYFKSLGCARSRHHRSQQHRHLHRSFIDGSEDDPGTNTNF